MRLMQGLHVEFERRPVYTQLEDNSCSVVLLF